MYYVATLENSPWVKTPPPNERILRCLISPELDPTNHDIACGMTELQPGCTSDFRAHDEGEMFICIAGKGHVRVGDDMVEMHPISVVYVPKNTLHQIYSDMDDTFTLLWVLTPPFGGDRMVLEMAKQKDQ
ncbi:cupin domain-containing protein [Papillibacter cinnamivorans]|uniref:Cupin domain protein n=1 Tax=Papillibacter cinnamivorans DSM 12816 TaxID=1122930 RepID=A0A1W2AHN9_9FIRM|nr:cupin domain-containing protein [Papillibacter cinnamivorans]SMC59778.1 Cupin domain protein [Papillibacter cinnamivorans DSM 12816]